MKTISTLCALACCSLLSVGAAERTRNMQGISDKQLLTQSIASFWALDPCEKGNAVRQIGILGKDGASKKDAARSERPLLAPHFEIRKGNQSVFEDDFVFDSLQTKKRDNGSFDKIVVMKSKTLPVVMTLYVRAYPKENVFRVWTKLRNEGKEKLELIARDAASVFLPSENAPWISTFGGHWGAEMTRFNEFQLGEGADKNFRIFSAGLSHNSQGVYPGIFISLDGKAEEDSGRVLGAAFGWDGNWQMRAEKLDSGVRIAAGALEEPVSLSPGETYVSPSLLLSWSSNGKGQASRNFHRYMLKRNGIFNPQNERPVVLNSWEGIGINITEKEILRMIDDAAKLGAEIFVLDDGWFGGRYPRNVECSQGLGDWKIDKRKLPNGFKPLIEACRKNGLRFGLWFEPEMVNSKSELFDAHPDWVVREPGKDLVYGRGGTQLMLDFAKPEVRDYAYHAIADILKANPGIEYVKWDQNMGGSRGTISDDHNNGVLEVAARLRKDFPKVMFQLCASGGGRADVGTMRLFEEFWASDETNGLRRIPIQWGFSHFFPSKAIASHINRHGPACSYKFRADVAMAGRLGVELRPADLKEEDLKEIRAGIAAYKELRPLLHAGELYRGRSPHESPVTEFTIVSEDKSQAVLFAFRASKGENEPDAATEIVRPSGLDPKKSYCLVERNSDGTPRIRAGIVMTGKELMQKGIRIDFPNAPSSAVILLAEGIRTEK